MSVTGFNGGIRRLEHAATLYEAALRTGGLGTWETDFVAGTRTWTKTAAEIFGLDVETEVPIPLADRDHLRELMHADDRHLIDAYHRQLHDVDEIEVAYRIDTAGKGIRHLAGRGQVMERNADGIPSRVVHIIADVTRQQEIEAHNQLLVRELSHRTKNLMAVISAMARQTSRKAASIADFERAFGDRLEGMSRSLDLLVSQDWSPTSIRRLVEAQLASFVEAESERLELRGETLHIDADTAQVLGMALHELSTNAVKYGALSVPEGRVVVSWSAHAGTQGAPLLRFRWSEHGGPEVRPGPARGFGSVVLREIAESTFKTAVRYEMRPTGVLWEFEAPLLAV
ncbi:HWE histidine kinase domain-containing protein [Sulfitobacter sp. D35]|uniref:sensor histidine kinase n=1 Tax=Sulfitobacter sp. D35 TaxID=3083252 RepID=UPI00296E3D69|nr:HWE histidine kinase domain-containing protein [Sulfitobacter sp. D35]MDW4496419.1 HWE histidine kinase domain-containing protein [Sulfitobacter sp. D35]